MQSIFDRYENVADHYGIPSIQVGTAIGDGEVSGAWSIDDLFRDRLHTAPRGAEVMADLAMEALQHILAIEDPVPRAVPNTRLHAGSLESARLWLPDAMDTWLPDAFKAGRFRLVLPLIELESGNGLWIQTAPGDIWGLLIVAGPHSGDILLETEGINEEYRTWDKWCDRHLLRTVMFAAPVRRGAELRLRVTDHGGVETVHPKLLKVVGLMLADAGDGGARTIQNRVGA